MTVEIVLERAASDVFHNDEGQSVDFADGVNGDDVWMMYGRGGLRFPRKSLSCRRIAGHGRRQHLNRRPTLEGWIKCLVHQAHAALTDDFRRLVRVKLDWRVGPKRALLGTYCSLVALPNEW